MRLLPGPGAAVLLVLVAGCAAIPADPDGSLEFIRGERLLRAGAAPHEPWVTAPAAPGQDPSGPEVELVEAFADRLGAEVEWTVSTEGDLVEQLELDLLDLVVGGLAADTPYSKRAALTRPYTESVGPRGTTVKHVMAVPMGENALLSELELFLDEEVAQ